MRTKFSGIWKAVFVLLLVLFAAAAFAQPGEQGKKYVIHGKPVDRRAVENMMEESIEDGEVWAGKTVSKLKGRFKLDKNRPVEEAALDFIDRHRNMFGLKNPKAELKLVRKSSTLRFNQLYNEIPIWGKEMVVHINKDRELDDVDSSFVPTPDIDTKPAFSPEEAIKKAEDHLNKMAGGKAEIDSGFKPTASLVIYPLAYGTFKLAYLVEICSEKPRGSWDCFVDAKDGGIIALQDTRRPL